MVRLRAHVVAAWLLLVASVNADPQPQSGGVGSDALALIQSALKSGSKVGLQHGGAGKSPEEMTPAEKERQKERQRRANAQRKIEREAKAKGCPVGFSLVSGDVAGGDQFGRDNRHKTDTLELCAEDCTSKPECKSFEWSPNVHTCAANKEAPAKYEKSFQDFMLCVLNTTQGPPAAPIAEALATAAPAAEAPATALAAAAGEAAPSQAPPKEEGAQAAEQSSGAQGSAGQPESKEEAAAPAAAEEAKEDSKLQLNQDAQESAEHGAKEAAAEELKRQEAERKAKEEAERAAAEKARQEAEQQLRQQEAERKAKEEAERAEAEKARQEAEQQLRQQEAERKAKEEEEAKRVEAEKAQQEAEQQLRQQEAERKAKEEAERAEREEAEEARRKVAEAAQEEAEHAEPSGSGPMKMEKAVRPHTVEPQVETSAQEAEQAEAEAERLEREEAARRAQEAKELELRLAREMAEHQARQEAEIKARAEAQKLEREKAKEEADRKAKEAMCSTGYHFVDGDVPGWDQFGHENVKKANINLCRKSCDAVEECLSYEWSPTTKICSMNKDHQPALGRFEDYIFCQRTQESLDKLVADRQAAQQAAEEQAARLAKEREAAAQVAKAESDQELEGVRALAALEAKHKLEQEEKRKAEEAQRVAEKERKVREREEARINAEMEKDLINIDDAAAADEEEERQKVEKQRAEEDAARREVEEQAKKKEEAEAAQQRKIEEEMEAERRAKEEAKRLHEEEAKQRADEEARLKAEEEAKQEEIINAVRLAQEQEQQAKAQEEQQKADEETVRQVEEAKRREEEEERKKAEEEARLKELELDDPAEAAIQRRRAEVKAKMAAALERKRLMLEKRRKKEEAEGLQMKMLEDEIKARQKEEAEKKVAEEVAVRQREAEEQAQREAEQAKHEAEEAARIKAQEEAFVKAEAEHRQRAEAEETEMEKKVMAASRPFEAENAAEDSAKKTQIMLRLQDSHGKTVNLKVSRTLRMKVMMNAACARLGILLADAQFTHGGRQIKATDTPDSFGLEDNDLVKVDDFIKVDDLLAEEETKDEDAAAKAAREMFEAAQREWEGGKAKDAAVELSTAEKARISEKDAAEARKWQANISSALKALPPARSADQAMRKATQVAAVLTEDEIAGLIYGTFANQVGHYMANTQNISRLDIPNLRVQQDAYRFRKFVKGIQKTVTCWPSALALASSWDEDLVGRVAGAIAVELRGKGANVMIGPSVSVHRVASAGRNFEQLSGEDPYLGSRLVKSYVRAVQKEGVVASVRPFGFHQQETNRKNLDVQVSDKVAWELYYPPFEAAIQAGAGGVTCSSDKVNGVSGCENAKLLKHDLKGAMQFKGFVMSEDTLPPSSPAYENGLDLNLPGASDHKVKPANLGSASAAAKKEAAAHVLSTVYRHRIDELPMWQPAFGLSSQASDQRTKENADLAREAAAAAVTLLKNDGVLPLDPSSVKRIAVLGSAASALPKVAFWVADYFSGGGVGHIPASNVHEATALDQITRRAAAAKIEVTSLASNIELVLAREKAKEADVVIVVGATTSAEGSDRSSLALDDNVDELIATVAPLKPTVVLMQTPGAVLTPWRNDVSAVANLFLAGEATGAAWASMLFGDISPAGKLPLAMPKTEENTIRPQSDGVVHYTEGLRTSYRSNTLEAAFAFGHGLSYAVFTYGTPQVVGRGCLARACIRVEVTNSGTRSGAEVVQAYLQFAASESMPNRVLRSFHKTGLLQPGHKEEVFLVLTARDLSTYHAESGWVEQSNVKVDIGSSSTDIRQSAWVNVAVNVDTAGDAN